MGTVTITQGPSGVLVSADVSGLSPGAHGFHIHAVGACTPDFAAAGDHFNPGSAGHGFPHEDGAHAGDLPNIHGGADGAARADYFSGAARTRAPTTPCSTTTAPQSSSTPTPTAMGRPPGPATASPAASSSATSCSSQGRCLQV